MLEKNHLQPIYDLSAANEEKNITIKKCLEEELLSQKRFCSFSKKIISSLHKK